MRACKHACDMRRKSLEFNHVSEELRVGMKTLCNNQHRWSMHTRSPQVALSPRICKLTLCRSCRISCTSRRSCTARTRSEGGSSLSSWKCGISHVRSYVLSVENSSRAPCIQILTQHPLQPPCCGRRSMHVNDAEIT